MKVNCATAWEKEVLQTTKRMTEREKKGNNSKTRRGCSPRSRPQVRAEIFYPTKESTFGCSPSHGGHSHPSTIVYAIWTLNDIKRAGVPPVSPKTVGGRPGTGRAGWSGRFQGVKSIIVSQLATLPPSGIRAVKNGRAFGAARK